MTQTAAPLALSDEAQDLLFRNARTANTSPTRPSPTSTYRRSTT